MGAQKNEKKLKRVTLEQLLAAKMQREKDKLKVEEIEVPSLGGTLLFKRPADEDIFDIVNAIDKDDDIRVTLDQMANIIYKCCDQLHDKELYETMEAGDPVDVVFMTMSSSDIIQVGNKVCGLNELYADAGEQVKNS